MSQNTMTRLKTNEERKITEKELKSDLQVAGHKFVPKNFPNK